MFKLTAIASIILTMYFFTVLLAEAIASQQTFRAILGFVAGSVVVAFMVYEFRNELKRSNP